MTLKMILLVVLGYLLGSIPNGVIIGKTFKGIDIREHGSKNTGATNAFRVLGKNLGITVFFLDMFKGMISLFIASSLGIKGDILVVIGVIAIVGHMFSPFLKFKGGKGIATGFGVFLYLTPIEALMAIAVFIVIVAFTKYISAGSIAAAIVLPIFISFLPVNRAIESKSLLLVFTILICAYVIFKHRSNITRLLKGEENKFNFK